MNRTIFIFAATALALTASFAAAQGAPGLVNYQGTLTDAAGQPITGDHNMEFNIYDAAIGGALVWGPQSFLAVPFDVQGRFNVILGPEDADMDPLEDSFTGGTDRFLEIIVDGGVPITPRQQFLSAPYAVSATTAETAFNVIPVGSITAYGGTVAPPDWLLCDGSAVSRTEFAALFAAIGTSWGEGDGVTTFNLPDLRGRFLRGVDMGAGNDPDAGSRTESNTGGNTGDAVGSVQDDATARPTTNFTTNSTGAHRHSYTRVSGIGGTHGAAQAASEGTSQNSSSNGSHAHSITGGGDSETRPLNAAVVWIVRH